MFSSLDVSHFLRVLLLQFLGKHVTVEEVLDNTLFLQGKIEGERSTIFLIMPVLARHDVGKLVEFFLKHPFRDCRDGWRLLFATASIRELLHTVACTMADNTLEMESATLVLEEFLETAEPACKYFHWELVPLMFLSLLGQIHACGAEHQELRSLAQHILEQLYGAAGIWRDDVAMQDLAAEDSFQYGLSTMLRHLIQQEPFIVKDLDLHILGILIFKIPNKLPEVAMTVYLELLHCKYGLTDGKTMACLLRGLEHLNARLQQLSCQELALLVQSEVAPSSGIRRLDQQNQQSEVQPPADRAASALEPTSLEAQQCGKANRRLTGRGVEKPPEEPPAEKKPTH